MKLYQRYFFYGSVLTSCVWALMIYLYVRMDDTQSQFKSSHLKWKAKFKAELPHHSSDFDAEYERDFGKNQLEDADDSDEEVEKPIIDETHDGRKMDDLSDLGIIRNSKDQAIRNEGDKLYAFNLLISDRLSLHRAIPDTRHQECNSHVYPSQLPSASVVICFHNEALSALLRTIHSVIDRTPNTLLHEIILVDDFSSLSHLRDELEEYINKKFVSVVKLVRTSERQGLIRARMFGARQAKGQVLVFLDSHCEVNVNWLQPLLVGIHEDPRTVSIPVIDIINQDTFNYEASPLVKGGFNWGLHFRWDNIQPEYWKKNPGFTSPIPTPTMAGGLFAIEREYFKTMGEYDSGLDIWGGENLEISFRIWQCGGRLEIVPCSRVGHIFRKRRPYTSPGGDAMLRNSLRVANVWMDEYKEYFYKMRPDARTLPFGDITDRLELRKSLKCKSFQWYLENVYPEQTLPDDKGRGGWAKGQIIKPDLPKTMKEGHLVHVSSGLCVVVDGDIYTKRALLKLTPCHQADKDQVWQEMEKNVFKLAGVLCLDVEKAALGDLFPRLMKCHYSGGSQEWKWMGHFQKQLYNPSSGKCLGKERKLGALESQDMHLTMELCDDNNNSLNFQLRSWVKS